MSIRNFAIAFGPTLFKARVSVVGRPNGDAIVDTRYWQNRVSHLWFNIIPGQIVYHLGNNRQLRPSLRTTPESL